MSDAATRHFPGAVCWKPKNRAEVMNTIAHDAKPCVFRATHFPSFLQQAGNKQGQRVRVAETDYLKDFMALDHVHIFDVAVGDTGVGKSHFIRWMGFEIGREVASGSRPYHLVEIPRSSANLGDVVRKILHGFEGESVTRVRSELDKQHRLDLSEAVNRVYDELAIALEKGGAKLLTKGEEAREDERTVLGMLPSLIRSPEFRRVLGGRGRGIVSHLAEHVLGKRQSDPPDENAMRWRSEDLQMTPVECAKMGKQVEAAELAAWLMDDPAAREIAVECLNRAWADAILMLLRFRSGDLKRCLEEIRAELQKAGKDLVLLIEDLSVTEGLDGELIEALLVRTRDTGKELCRLRSIVGVTQGDFDRFRENIHGRIRRSIFFDMPLDSSAKDASTSVSRGEMLDFTSRYLNATRYDIDQLEAWSDDEHPEPLSSACEQCCLRPTCHEAFGEVEGRGLYPFTPIALERLYKAALTSTKGGDGAFNPRKLVGRVLNDVLEEAEQSLEDMDFPRTTLVDSFGLHGVKAQVELALQDRFESRTADRLLRAIDLYAPQPGAATPAPPSKVCRALGLPELETNAPMPEAPRKQPRPKESQGESSTSSADHGLNRFEQWARRSDLGDKDLNVFRQAVEKALRPWIDWDAEGLNAVREQLSKSKIFVEGQHTSIHGDPVLTIVRSPSAAIALQVLVEGSFDAPNSEHMAIQTRLQVESWANEVCGNLRRLLNEPGDPTPVELAAEILALGSALRGQDCGKKDAVGLLSALFEPWPKEASIEHRSGPWKDLWRKFEKKSADVVKLLSKELACSKGGSAGAFIDPTRILSALESVQKTGRPRPRPAEADKWVLHGDVNDLAVAVEASMQAAIEAEVGACHEWLELVEAAVGETTPAQLVSVLKESLQAAAAEDLRNDSGMANIDQRLDNLKRLDFEVQMRLARNATQEPSGLSQLATLGKLNRQAMDETRETLVAAHRVIERSVQKVQSHMGQLGQGIDPEAMKREIDDQLAGLVSALTDLGGS